VVILTDTIGSCKDEVKSLYLIEYHTINKSCDSSVGIALGYGLDDRGSKV
jgi:hypothetical protein